MARFFIDRPIFAWVIAIVIMLAGALSIQQLPVSQYPSIAPPAIVINAKYPAQPHAAQPEPLLQLARCELAFGDHRRQRAPQRFASIKRHQGLRTVVVLGDCSVGRGATGEAPDQAVVDVEQVHRQGQQPLGRARGRQRVEPGQRAAAGVEPVDHRGQAGVGVTGQVGVGADQHRTGLPREPAREAQDLGHAIALEPGFVDAAQPRSAAARQQAQGQGAGGQGRHLTCRA